jgi:hypothetical protein
MTSVLSQKVASEFGGTAGSWQGATPPAYFEYVKEEQRRQGRAGPPNSDANF